MRERRYRFPDSDAVQYVIWITLLIVVCALTLFANLEGRDLWGADESRHLVVVSPLSAASRRGPISRVVWPGCPLRLLTGG
jgi:hypothetical protein